MVHRGLVLGLAYLASTFVSALAVVVFSSFQQSVVWTDQLALIFPVVLVLGLGVAWIPLTVSLMIALRRWRSRLAASLSAGVFTAFVLLVWQGRLVDSFLSVAVSPMEPPLADDILQNLPYVAGVGLLGGFAFWAVAFRGRRA